MQNLVQDLLRRVIFLTCLITFITLFYSNLVVNFTISSTLILFGLTSITMEAGERVLQIKKGSWLEWIKSNEAIVARCSFFGAASIGSWSVGSETSNNYWYILSLCMAGFAMAPLIRRIREEL